uniref:Uncharacterized protein n=1 Tax=Setaria viridis TaxID=4556 RepID=A0A4U6VA45_SETVI|nr:hypothetical protein SEVIR_3G110101v2 [Setaria viridis]
MVFNSLKEDADFYKVCALREAGKGYLGKQFVCLKAGWSLEGTQMEQKAHEVEM